MYPRSCVEDWVGIALTCYVSAYHLRYLVWINNNFYMEPCGRQPYNYNIKYYWKAKNADSNMVFEVKAMGRIWWTHTSALRKIGKGLRWGQMVKAHEQTHCAHDKREISHKKEFTCFWTENTDYQATGTKEIAPLTISVNESIFCGRRERYKRVEFWVSLIDSP